MKLTRAFCLFFLVIGLPVFADAEKDAQDRLAVIHYGTETEIAALIQTLKGDPAYSDDNLDAELVNLARNARNQKILTGVLSFFGARGKEGLEDRCLTILENRDNETGEAVLAAIDYFGKIKSPQATSALEGLISSGVSNVTGAAIRALGHTANTENADEIADYLIDLYTNHDPGAGNNGTLISALGETGSKKAVPFLVDLVKDSGESATIRIAAIESLAKIKDDAGLSAILGAITTSEPLVRTAAVGALGPFSGKEVDDAILENFRDSFFRTRVAAAKASGERKLEAAIPYLKYRAEKDEALPVKEQSIRALGEIGTEDAVTVLEGLFAEQKNPDRVRLLSAETLMKNSADAYTEKVIEAMDDAQKRRQTVLYNGFLKTHSSAKSSKLEDLARRFFASGSGLEKSSALDITLNNQFTALTEEVRTLTDPKKGGAAIAAKAQSVLDKL
jgi:HEAT repeat protein